MDWREYASKMVVLIADAPPHGIGEYGDGQYFLFFDIYFMYYLFSLNCMTICSGFDEGSPDGNDPLQLARTMASRGITLASFQHCHEKF